RRENLVQPQKRVVIALQPGDTRLNAKARLGGLGDRGEAGKRRQIFVRTVVFGGGRHVIFLRSGWKPNLRRRGTVSIIAAKADRTLRVRTLPSAHGVCGPHWQILRVLPNTQDAIFAARCRLKSGHHRPEPYCMDETEHLSSLRELIDCTVVPIAL